MRQFAVFVSRVAFLIAVSGFFLSVPVTGQDKRLAAPEIDSELAAAPKGTFSIVVIPDTQHYRGSATKSTPDSEEPLTNPVFGGLTDWIVANQERQRIAFVSHVGDIVDINNQEQWALARKHMDKLHGRVPYAISVGNHDMTGAGDSSLFQEVFPKSRFEEFDWYAGCFENPSEAPAISGNNANSVQLFEAEGMKFVFLHLECNAPDDVLAWADSILEKYSDRRALITTHMGLGPRDKPRTSADYFDAPKGRMRWAKRHGDRGNTPQQMWEKCFRKHRNLFMICSGDQSRTQAMRQESVGEHGNVVHELLSDYGAEGLRVMRFIPAGNCIEVRTWNPLKGSLCESTKIVPNREQHQFALRYDMTAARFEPGKPNVLFIGVDDLRPELNCYGATHIHSPNIDRLASEGVLFERAYCQWAVCMPSRASMLTGLRPDSFKGKAQGFRKVVPDVVTLPQHFKNHGYFAQSFGKIFHGSWATAYVGGAYQDPVSWSAERWSASPQYYFSPEGMKIAQEIFATASPQYLFLGDAKRDPDDPDQWKKFFVRGPATEAPDVPDNLPADGAIADAALKRLRELVGRENSPPFFLAVGFQKPHLPFVAPKKYWDLYDPEKIPPVAVPERPRGVPDFALKPGANELNQYLEKTRGLVSPERTRHLRHGYAACVSYVDAQVGRLLDELEGQGIRDETIVVLWSDHGYKLGDFGSWAKHTNFELDTRVPLIVSAPGLPKDQRSKALVELVDLHPTLSELAGLPIHPGADGESFAANVRESAASGQEAAFSQYPKGGFMGYSVRTRTHRYTEWRRKSGAVAETELYEYDDGGIERINLADQPAQSEIQKELQRLLYGALKQPSNQP